jgi:hypothetical protein
LTALSIAFVVFLCCFGAALAGMVLHRKLPDHHLDGDSKDVVKLVMGLIATTAALVLGLLIASAKNSYDTQTTELQQVSATLVQLDRTLSLYGPETRDARDSLKRTVAVALQRVWPADGGQPANLEPSLTRDQADAFYGTLQNLSPKTEGQRHAQSSALQLAANLAQTRILMFEQLGGSVSWPLLMVLVFWLSVLFLGFGLFARFHINITVTLIVGALSVASAVFLILELSQPYQGLMRIPDTSLRGALAQMER